MEGLHVRERLDRLERRFTQWLVLRSIVILRVGLGVIFVGFGFLKFFPGFSPIEGLVMDTVDVLSLGIVPARVGIVLLATLECTIGLGLITGRFLRLTLVLLGFQMIGAMSPLLLFPNELFSGPLHAPSLEGQYVIKDVVLISAGLVVSATVRGARLVSERVHRSEDYRSYQGRVPGKKVPGKATS